ncbi:MAG: glycosyltransferase family 2 protein [Ktedonobacteraceae bacterium]
MEGIIALPVLYLCVVSLSARLRARWYQKQPATFSPPYARFAILIPAHNEVPVLGTLLASLAALDYPADDYAIYVVADNCTDTTAELARASGRVSVYERFDQEKRGKGFALSWIWQQLAADQLFYDAYIVLDADSVVEATFLQTMNRGIAQGARALQAHNTVLNVADSPSTALRWLALTLMNHVRPLGRNGLRCSSTLTGNGMCLSRELLDRHPWQAFSLSEDYQYYLGLVQHGEKVLYVPDAVVRSEMPVTFAQMRTQDIRWEASQDTSSAWRTAGKLLHAGIRNRDFVRLEAVAELLTPSLSTLLSLCVLTLVGSLLVWSLPALLFSLLLIGGVLGYISTAFALLQPPRTVFLALLSAPRFVLWKLWVLLVLRKSKKYTGAWVRTVRNS